MRSVLRRAQLGPMLKLLIRFGLRFDDPQDERRFVARFMLDDLARTQSAMLLGAFVYSIFSLWDWILDPGAFRRTLALRLAVALTVLLPAAAALSVKRLRRFAEPIYLVYCVVPGCVLSLIYLQIDQGFDHASAGMIIIILFVSTLLPLRLPSLIVFCICTWVCFAICEAFADEARAGMRVINSFEIGTAYALSLYAVGAREIQARRQFHTSNALRVEKDRSEASLAELRNTQSHLVQAEKLASLGQLVAGVAHEVSTPLGLALTTSTVIEGDIKRLDATLQSGAVRRSDLTQGIARLGEGLRLLFANLHRATELVHSFKQVATDQANEERRSFEMRGWLMDAMSTLHPLLSRRGHEIGVSCPDGLMIDTYPGALSQVVSTLALNAAVHGFPDGNKGVLDLTILQNGPSELRIVFADNGVGIAPENLRKVFDPFFTTRRDKGHMGLGLHIVYNLVVSTLRGQIVIASEPGDGTRFVIDLPLTLDE